MFAFSTTYLDVSGQPYHHQAEGVTNTYNNGIMRSGYNKKVTVFWLKKVKEKRCNHITDTFSPTWTGLHTHFMHFCTILALLKT